MDLRQRWVIARQEPDTQWLFFADRGHWTAHFHEAVLFHTLWGAEEAKDHSAAGKGTVRNAAEVYEFVAPLGVPGQGTEVAA